MAFKMRSGNKVSFKNMGSSSPGKHDTGSQHVHAHGGSGSYRKDDEGNLQQTGVGGDIDKDDHIKGNKFDTEKNQQDTTTNKEAGDKKTESHFDFTDALKGFLESGGGKEGLLKGIGAGISKKSPNEKLAIQKARNIRKAKKEANKKVIQEASNLDTNIVEEEKKPKGKGWIWKAGKWVRETVDKVQQAIIDKKAENQAKFDETNTLDYVDPTVVEDSSESEDDGGEVDLTRKTTGPPYE